MEDAAAREENLPGPHWLSDLTRVGPTKPLGYLSLDAIQESGSTVLSVVAEAEAQGLSWARWRPEDTDDSTDDVLYVWDARALRKLLWEHRYTLAFWGWPCSPAAFVAFVVVEVIPERCALRSLIALAFGNGSQAVWPTSEGQAKEFWIEDGGEEIARHPLSVHT